MVNQRDLHSAEKAKKARKTWKNVELLMLILVRRTVNGANHCIIMEAASKYSTKLISGGEGSQTAER